MKNCFRLVFLALAVLSAPCEDFPKLKITNNASPSMAGYDHEIWRWNYVRSRVSVLAEIQYRELWSDAYVQSLAAQAEQGNLPDVFYLWPQGKTDFLYDRHLAKDLGPLLKDSDVKGFMAQALDPRFQKGHFLAILPTTLKFSPVFFVNTAVLTSLNLKPAATIDELKAQIPVLAKAGITPVLSLGEPAETRLKLFNLMAGRLVGEGVFEELQSGRMAFTDPRFVNLLTLFQDLVKTGILPGVPNSPADKPAAVWASNKAAYLLADDSLLALLVGDKKRGTPPLVAAKDQGKILVAAFPRFVQEAAGAPEAVCTAGPGFALGSALEDGSKKQAAALEVVKTLSSVFAQDDRLRTRFAYPSRLDVPAPKDLDPVELAYLKWMRGLKGGVVPLELSLTPAVVQALDQVLAGASLANFKPPESAKVLQAAWEKNRR